MNVWAISDLHLPAHEKPMDIFGPHWSNHFEKISADWKERVSKDDVVLLPGDLTWAMRLEEAIEDIMKLAELPGKKIILRGNHDYWWNAISRVRGALPEGCFALQNDAMEIESMIFAGSRGWVIPNEADTQSDDYRIYRRERQRLEMSLNCARRISPDRPPIVMMHYPPRAENAEGFSDILKAFDVRTVVYGHLHGAGIATAVCGEIDGIDYHLVSCDALDFKLERII